MTRQTAQLEKLTHAAAGRLLARARDRRGLNAKTIAPRLRVTLEKYLLRAQPMATARAIDEFFDKLHADDLLCVIACERGDEAAWQELIKTQTSTVLSAARSASNGAAEAEDLAQSIWAELYGLRARDDGKPAGKLAYYSGCGSLGGWLRAIVAQLAVDRHRRTARLVQTEDDAEFDALAQDSKQAESNAFSSHASHNPEQSLAEREMVAVVRDALTRAIAGLDPEDRLLIKLYYFDDMRLREAGALLGVHEATASRRLARAQSDIRKGVGKILSRERKWTTHEIARALADSNEFATPKDLQSLLTQEGETLRVLGKGER